MRDFDIWENERKRRGENKRRGSSSIEWEKSVGQFNYEFSWIYSLTKHVDISLIFCLYYPISIQIFRKSSTYLSMFKFFIYQLITLYLFTWNDKYSSNSSHFFATWTNLYEGRLITWKSRKNFFATNHLSFFSFFSFFSSLVLVVTVVVVVVGKEVVVGSTFTAVTLSSSDLLHYILYFGIWRLEWSSIFPITLFY